MGKKVQDKRKIKQGIRYKNGMHIADVVGMLYLLVMFGVYPWIMTNKYFNITITRFRFVLWSGIAFITFSVIACVVDAYIFSYYGLPYMWTGSVSEEPKRRCCRPSFWIQAFLLSNVFSFALAEDKAGAATGENGRYMGFWFYLLLIAVFVLLANRLRIKERILVVFELSILYAAVSAIYQHLEPVLHAKFWTRMPFAHYRDHIATKSFHKFISTFGNINIYAGFLAIAIPVLLCVFIYSVNLRHRIFSAVCLMFSGMTVMISNSDSAYIGIGAAFALLFFIAYKDDRLRLYFGGIVPVAVGNFITTVLNHKVLHKYDRRGGFAQALDKPGLALELLLVSVLLFVAALAARKFFGERIAAWNKRRVCIVLLCVMLFCAGAVIVYGACTHKPAFTFNYKWGTYRGYIWSKSVELFCNANPVQKLFGYGQECVDGLMRANYYDEMIAVTKQTYDNAHNELLQYLLTTGLVGVISYMGMLVSVFVYIWKRARGRLLAYVPLVAMTGYFVQSLINVNQPITTPFLFLFMGIGVGYVRESRNTEGTDADG